MAPDDTMTEPAPVELQDTRRTRRSRRQRITLAVFLIILLPVLLLGSGTVWFWWQLGTHGSPGRQVEVRIESGWGVPRIGDELQHDHVIGSSLAFNVYARFNGNDSFQAGTYEMHEHIGVRDAVSALRRGPKIDYVLLSEPPGLWLVQVAARVGQLPGRSTDTFLEDTRNNAVRSVFEPAGTSNLEGLLWPDTYKVSDSQDEIAILQTMVKEFDQNAAKLGLTNANVHGLAPYQILIVASMIQAEAKVEQDRPLIASVIYNRLAANMPLQIDSTVLYARGKPTDRSLSDADLRIPSPYNTYTHTGLPPTPIGSVGAASLRAALAPSTTNYLYYVLAGRDGHHAFSSTYAGQQQNIEAARAKGLL